MHFVCVCGGGGGGGDSFNICMVCINKKAIQFKEVSLLVEEGTQYNVE